MTTRAELEADIAGFVSMQASLIDLQEACDYPAYLGLEIELIDRAIARLRRDLAKLDGPAEGTFRVFVSIEGKQSGRTTCAAECDSYVYDSAESAQEQADPWTQAIVFVDLPIRTVPVIEGEVCDG